MTTKLDPFFAGESDGDPLLGQILSLANARWRITLLVEGHQITGTVIEPHEYLRLLDEQLAKYDTEMGSTAGYIRHGLGTANPQLDDVGWTEEEKPMWVHLSGATTVRGDTTQKIGLWRGRTSAVSGWTLRSPTRTRR